MAGFFVTATGTDIGKTFITAGLAKALHAKALKPVVSGFDGANPKESDPAALLQAMNAPVTPDNIARISPWRFEAPLSPDMAAARENRAIDLGELVAFTRANVKDGLVFVEGVGGVMVPLTPRHTTLDWMAEAKLPLILVTGSYLGTLSHTLTAADALTRRGLAVALVVVDEFPASPVPLAETQEVIVRHTGLACVTHARNAADFSKIAGALGYSASSQE